MQTATRSSTLIGHVLTLLLGAALAAGIWVVGYAELSWLGFASAALYGDTARWRRARGCLTRRFVR